VAALACCGIWLLLSPGEFSSGWQNGWALASAVMAAIAMIYLNISRRYHDSQTILFFMFGLGSLAMLLLCNDSIFLPDKTAFFFLFSCSAAGVLGQYLLTYGFLYVTAVEGSVISSTRILLAALLGPFLVGDPFLTLTGWCGAFLIFTADTILAFRKTRT
ncbi:MAG: EamA family transporter, partial [Proteobacteria bacterium]